jgi:hypothetical protein
MCFRTVFATILMIGLCGCGGDRGHTATPSDPNEQQGNPNAKPEKSVKPVSNAQADGDKAGKDPHTLTADHTAGEPKKK